VSTRPDVIAVRPLQVPVRPFYALGVLLDSEDFGNEQSYHRGRVSRAWKYLLGTGTVAGLRVVWRSETQQLAVEPGLALDPLGRLIEIARPVSMLLRGGPREGDSWFEHVSGVGIDDAARTQQLRQDLLDGVTPSAPRQLVADVFVRLIVCEHAKTPAFTTGPFDALDAATPARLRDGYEVALVIRPEAHTGTIPQPDDQEILDTQPTTSREDALQWARLRILDAWRDTSEEWTGNDEILGGSQPAPLQEHLQPRAQLIQKDPSDVGRDSTSVLLARVRIPVSLNGADPPSDLGQAPVIDNTLRRFVRHSGIYTQPVPPGGGP